MAESTTISTLELNPTGDNEAVAELAEGVEKIAIVAEADDTPAGADVSQKQQRPRIIYTRKQLVRLSQSPLVKSPDGMPPFKAWFGSVFGPYLSIGHRSQQAV